MIRETVFTNARVVLENEIVHGDVLVRDGVIADIATRHGSAATSMDSVTGLASVDFDGDLLMPGLVELHTDHLESHAQPRPGTHWDALPAVLAHDAQLSGAGVTTVFDAIRIGRQDDRDDATVLARSLALAVEHANGAGITRAEHFIHLRCEVAAPATIAEFEAFDDITSLRLASLMDHTPGQRQYADADAFRRYMVGKGRVSADGIDAMMQTLKDVAEQYSLPNRSKIAELAAARGIALAAHDDATIEHVEESASFGVRISEFPTTELAAQAARERDQLIVMGAPNIVRGGSQSGNVAAARLLELGLLDILSSDYVPASPLQAIVQLDADGIYPLEKGSALVSGNPARAVGLDDRGQIAVGKLADLVRVQRHAQPADERHPLGRVVPVVRAVYRRGLRVS
ncbi:alpha-D-ribose 1-methylphosphonate 5-triphosphate diphosphatase [Agreia sp. COWG]|uniref:alpha-D-ribose 1-methylphosphonate 5-triphosphate diphosphatase n=1 Tax=Agreia sp. COWG TaxID=2773266 RepID=UPI001927CB50|nr:alpha-D-ribose 1-methylphosphonate 5-triphosphate diphosphatase [Agreia sp. COWG]CAD6010940.1 carbon-phosphorus lyase complex subunit [Agreia sp. COWG]